LQGNKPLFEETVMSKLNSLIAAVALFAGIASATAGTLADVAIVDRSTGERLQTWRHEGRLYVAGRPGNCYGVEMSNRSGGRLLAVLSVDGVNAISGETAAGNQSGYVLDAWQGAEIAGWRKSMDDVAAFYFTRLPDSYAARTGRPDNVGVIGVAVYREYVEPRAELPLPATPWLSEAPAAKAAGPMHESQAARARSDERLGTGHGERLASATQYTDFRRASDYPAEVITLYYDSYAHLVARGVITGSRSPGPRPFPGGFVPDPNG
jgi:hypothetical protein